MVPDVSMIDRPYRVVRNGRKYIVETNVPDALGGASWQMVCTLIKEEEDTFARKGALPDDILTLIFDKIFAQDKEIMQLRLAAAEK